MATAKKKRKPPPKRAQRSLFASRPALPSLQLAPHQVDIIGLGLLAIGAFLAAVGYFHIAGGTLGNGAVKSMRFVFGVLGYALPAALLIAGGLILMRELRPPVRPMRTGVICLTAALTLAWAAGTLGVGPGAAHAGEVWHAASFESRGGVIGAAEFWITSHLISTLGADFLAVFLFVAGLILVSGATLAGVIRATGEGVVGTHRALRRSTDEFTVATAAVRRPPPDGATPPSTEPEHEPLLPPGEGEEQITTEMVVRATHVEAPPIDGTAEESEPIERARSRPRRGDRRRRNLGSQPGGPHPPRPIPRVDH